MRSINRWLTIDEANELLRLIDKDRPDLPKRIVLWWSSKAEMEPFGVEVSLNDSLRLVQDAEEWRVIRH